MRRDRPRLTRSLLPMRQGENRAIATDRGAEVGVAFKPSVASQQEKPDPSRLGPIDIRVHRVTLALLFAGQQHPGGGKCRHDELRTDPPSVGLRSTSETQEMPIVIQDLAKNSRARR